SKKYNSCQFRTFRIFKRHSCERKTEATRPGLPRRLSPSELLRELNCWWFPSIVENRRRSFLGPVESQHWDESRFGSGQPIRHFCFVRRLRLEIEVNRTVRVRYEFIARTERVTVNWIGNEKEVAVVHRQRPEAIYRRHLPLIKVHHVLLVSVILLAIGVFLRCRINRVLRTVCSQADRSHESSLDIVRTIHTHVLRQNDPTVHRDCGLFEVLHDFDLRKLRNCFYRFLVESPKFVWIETLAGDYADASHFGDRRSVLAARVLSHSPRVCRCNRFGREATLSRWAIYIR